MENIDNYNERKRKEYHARKTKRCLNCNEVTTNKYCNSSCQNEHRQKLVFEKIENGNTELDHRQYKKYLIYKFGAKCMECGWCDINPSTGKTPIELEHIDGNSENHNLNNLKLLCPNHHSLTLTYKGLNKGNGRHKRMERYNKKLSY